MPSECTYSTRANPASFAMLLKLRERVCISAGVVASMIMLNAAAVGGDTRSGLGTNSTIAARPPGQRRSHLAQKCRARRHIEVMQKIRNQRQIVAAAKIHIERASRNQVVAIPHPHRLRIRLRNLEHVLPVARVHLRRGILFRHARSHTSRGPRRYPEPYAPRRPCAAPPPSSAKA